MLSVMLILLFPLSILVKGLLLKLFWGWFVVPLGSPPIGTAHALGVALVAAMLTHQHSSEKGKEPDAGEMLVNMFILLLFGCVYRALMS